MAAQIDMPRAGGVFILLLLLISAGSLRAQTVTDKRKKFLEEILSINTPNEHRFPISRRVSLLDSTWKDWQARTGELPPDFDNMPSHPFLPEPLLDEKGRKISTREAWNARRDWIKKEFQHWVSGSIPPAPGNVKAQVLSDRMEGKVRVQMIRLQFGPQGRARMTLELMIPPGAGARPVYMTQWTHRSWAQLALRRGYITCVYAAADGMDDTEAYQALYPEYDFSLLMRRAWGASRVVDYLFTRKEIDTARIAVTGHSRNGKQSLWAAAFDDRIAAVVTSSCGTGGITPFRYSDPQYCNQTIDDICANAAHWFHPRLRFFFGREDRLPVDQNLLLSLIAPRALLMHYSIVERQLNPWANEQCYQSVKKVYDFLGKADNIGVFPRMGEHAVTTRDLERCLDFLDDRFSRRKLHWENVLYYANTGTPAERPPVKPVFLSARYSDTTAFKPDKQRILHNLQWLLGEEPPGVCPARITPGLPSRQDWISSITGRPQVPGARIIHLTPYNSMGDHLSGMLYCPADTAAHKKMPVIIYLHQYAYAHGFAFGYNKDGGNGNSKLFRKLIEKGYAVLAIDMLGFGTRIEEGKYFYERYPQWSKMGKMVNDVKACVDALTGFDDIDHQRIYVLGNTIGGSVGLMAAAEDERIAGVAAVAAFSPWRSSNRQYESLRTYSDLHGFLPALRGYAEKPGEAPVDFGEILSCIAPRKLLVIAPSLDRHADAQAVRRTMNNVEEIYQLYNAPQQLEFQTPAEINRLSDNMIGQVLRFFAG
ncbi:alpha/beta fold hydrolase [Chitinophaga cymbidii]|nr:alpha/beta fold hydrolase [Chitinophaga cymbidii]